MVELPLSTPDPNPLRRDILLGRNSLVWQRLATDWRVAERVICTIGHRDVAGFEFTENDRVWVFSYSRLEHENKVLLQRLQDARVAEIVYLSSSSTRIAAKVSCYEYPRIKRQAELLVDAMPIGRVLTVGLIYESESELPSGHNAATSINELAEFMLAPLWTAKRTDLLRMVKRPFSSKFEQLLYRSYSFAIMATGNYPCMLRPVDLILRALGMQWYGYVYLSNRAWISTIS